MQYFWSILLTLIVLAPSISGQSTACADVCGDPHRPTAVQHGNEAGDSGASELQHDCKCVCHHPASGVADTPIVFSGATSDPLMLPGHPDEFAPDAEPSGVDHPPQLA